LLARRSDRAEALSSAATAAEAKCFLEQILAQGDIVGRHGSARQKVLQNGTAVYLASQPNHAAGRGKRNEADGARKP